MPSFYLYNNQRALIESDQIEFASAASPVCCHWQQSCPSDVSPGSALAPSADAVLGQPQEPSGAAREPTISSSELLCAV